jgi:hypothetical protein
MTEFELKAKLNEALQALERFERENGGIRNASLYKAELNKAVIEIGEKKSYEPTAEGRRCGACGGSGRV